MTTALTNLKIWDGEQQLDADTLVLTDDVITGIGDRELARDAATTIDCAGATALPGLIDAHVHLELNPDDHVAPLRTEDGVQPHMRERAEAMARAGITTARDLGGGAWYELALRDAVRRGEVLGPRLLCAGQPITSPSGHCHFWGGEAASLTEANAVMDRQIEHGVDLIKIMATGGRMTRGSQPTDAQFDQPTMSALVDRAHERALPVAAHCHGTAGIEIAARAGVDTIEHCSWVGAEGWASDFQTEVAELILTQGCWVSPTVNKGWQRMLDSQTGAVLGRVRSAYRSMIDRGIPFVASTDAGIPGVYHADLPAALRVFAEIAELSAAEALASATSSAAKALGIERTTGRLRAGLAADVLLVDGDPLSDLGALTRPVGVWLRGRAALEP